MQADVVVLESSDEDEKQVPAAKAKAKVTGQKRRAAGADPSAGAKRPHADADAAPAAEPVLAAASGADAAAVAPPAEPAAAPCKDAALVARPDKPPLPDFQTDGKPLRWIKRMTAEYRKIFEKEGQVDSGVVFELRGDGDDLSIWKFALSFDKSTELGKSLLPVEKTANSSTIDLEIDVPADYPMKPPFVRILYPELQGGYIFEHGAICFEALTPKGWPAAMTLPALATSIKGLFDSAGTKVIGWGHREKKIIPQYTKDGAKKDFAYILRAHDDGAAWSNHKLKS